MPPDIVDHAYVSRKVAAWQIGRAEHRLPENGAIPALFQQPLPHRLGNSRCAITDAEFLV
jgi:hypothetical protein